MMTAMKLVLGSKSPRRKELLKNMGYTFEIRVQETDESYPPDLKMEEIPIHIARQKAAALKETLQPDETLLTSDTIVVLNDEVMGKPEDRNQAMEMLTKLSGKTHQVISGLCLWSGDRELVQSVTTHVTFRTLSQATIEHYIDTYKPYDKAGAYGIQEWIGLIGVEKIEGSYTNVVGLPTTELAVLLEEL